MRHAATVEVLFKAFGDRTPRGIGQRATLGNLGKPVGQRQGQLARQQLPRHGIVGNRFATLRDGDQMIQQVPPQPLFEMARQGRQRPTPGEALDSQAGGARRGDGAGQPPGGRLLQCPGHAPRAIPQRI